MAKAVVKRKTSKNQSVTIKQLDKELWTLFSQYIRKKDADWKGFVKCFTCSVIDEWKYFDAGHCIPKSTTGSYLKYDERNNRPQCKTCNQGKGGMRKEFEAGLKRIYGESIIIELKRYTEKSLTVQEYKDKIIKYKSLVQNFN